MSDINAMIKWMTDREKKVSYSMDHRTGPYSYDCSSAVFYALQSGGFTTFSYPGNTETLYSLVGKLFKQIPRSEARRGDIFVSGVIGQSTGSGGHTGIFLSNDTIIHCTYSKGKLNMAITPAKNWMGDYSGLPVHCYRLIGVAEVPHEDAKPQITQLAVDGSWGPATTRRLQEYFACAIRDGIISGQIKGAWSQNIPSIEWGTGGSNLIREMQKWLGVTADGNMGPGTIRALQKRMGTIQDGVISTPSDVVREMQRRLNANKL